MEPDAAVLYKRSALDGAAVIDCQLLARAGLWNVAACCPECHRCGRCSEIDLEPTSPSEQAFKVVVCCRAGTAMDLGAAIDCLLEERRARA